MLTTIATLGLEGRLLSVALDAYLEGLARALAGIRRTMDELKEESFKRMIGRRFE